MTALNINESFGSSNSELAYFCAMDRTSPRYTTVFEFLGPVGSNFSSSWLLDTLGGDTDSVGPSYISISLANCFSCHRSYGLKSGAWLNTVSLN